MKDEQVTFDGIPIPLTLETLLDVMIMAHSCINIRLLGED